MVVGDWRLLDLSNKKQHHQYYPPPLRRTLSARCTTNVPLVASKKVAVGSGFVLLVIAVFETKGVPLLNLPKKYYY